MNQINPEFIIIITIVLILTTLTAILIKKWLVNGLQRLYIPWIEKVQKILNQAQLDTQQILHQNQQQYTEHSQRTMQLHLEQLQNYTQQLQHNQQQQITDNMGHFKQTMTNNMQHLNQQVTDNVTKANHIYQQMLERLTTIDIAQKKIHELSSNIISLQDILSNKQSRGVFGETQLNRLIQDTLPTQYYQLQYTFSNGKRSDCALIMPGSNYVLAIDAKFPMENYRMSIASQLTKIEKTTAQSQFKKNMLMHLKDIANKYIITGETVDYACLFIPSESVFLEIHHQYPDIVEQAQQFKVWLVSPTTMMAVLTTLQNTIRDHATEQHLQTIRNHLNLLAKDFQTFHSRIDNTSKHIKKAHEEINRTQHTAEKIVKRFQAIEPTHIASNEPSTLTIDD